MFTNKTVTNPFRKKVTLIENGIPTDELIVDIEDAPGNVTNPGTPITAEALNSIAAKFNNTLQTFTPLWTTTTSPTTGAKALSQSIANFDWIIIMLATDAAVWGTFVFPSKYLQGIGSTKPSSTRPLMLNAAGGSSSYIRGMDVYFSSNSVMNIASFNRLTGGVHVYGFKTF